MWSNLKLHGCKVGGIRSWILSIRGVLEIRSGCASSNSTAASATVNTVNLKTPERSETCSQEDLRSEIQELKASQRRGEWRFTWDFEEFRVSGLGFTASGL